MQYIKVNGGHSNPKGFCVDVEYRGNKKRFGTHGFDDGEKMMKQIHADPFNYGIDMFLGLFLVVVFWITGQSLFEYFGNSVGLIGKLVMLLAGIALAKIIIEIRYTIFNDAILRWHACEHKFACIIETGKESSLANLKDTDPVHVSCGSTSTFSVILMLVSVIYLGPIFGSVLVGFLFGCLLCYFVEPFSLYRIPQRLILLREPGQHHYFEAEKIGKKVCEWTEQIDVNEPSE